MENSTLKALHNLSRKEVGHLWLGSRILGDSPAGWWETADTTQSMADWLQEVLRRVTGMQAATLHPQWVREQRKAPEQNKSFHSLSLQQWSTKITHWVGWSWVHSLLHGSVHVLLMHISFIIIQCKDTLCYKIILFNLSWNDLLIFLVFLYEFTRLAFSCFWIVSYLF